MDRTKKMIKTTGIYFIGNFASKILTFFLIPMYTSYLSTESFGEIDLLTSLLPLIGPIFSLSIVDSVFRFLCEERKKGLGKKAITNSFLIFILGASLFLLGYVFVLFLHPIKFAVLFIIYVYVTYLGQFLQQILRGLQENTEYAVTGVLSTFAQAGLNVLFIVYLHMNGEALLLSAIGASSLISIYIIIKIKIWKYIDLKLISKAYIIDELRYGLPLIPNQICWWAIQILGKYFLAYFGGSQMNGIYAISEKFPSLFSTISSIFFLAWTENLIYEYDSNDRDDYCTTSFNNMVMIFILLIAGLLPCVKLYNVLTISGDYSSAWLYVPPLLIGTLFNSFATYFGSFYTASMNTKPAFFTTIIAGITNVVVSLILIPRIFIWGVVIANMISFITFALVRWFSIKPLITLKINLKMWFVPMIIVLISIICYYINSYILQCIMILVVSIAICLCAKDVILAVLKALKKG